MNLTRTTILQRDGRFMVVSLAIRGKGWMIGGFDAAKTPPVQRAGSTQTGRAFETLNRSLNTLTKAGWRTAWFGEPNNG